MGRICRGRAARDGRRTCLTGPHTYWPDSSRFGARQLARPIVDELSQHLEDRYRELIAGRASIDDATGLTLAEFRNGNVLAQYMAPLRQAHSRSALTPGSSSEQLLGDDWCDVRHAARSFWKQPGFPLAAILTLAIGIGASTSVFSVVYGVLLKPLPFNEPDRLVGVWHTAPTPRGRLRDEEFDEDRG